MLTPEQLDSAAASLVNTAGTLLGQAVSQKAGTSTGTATGVVAATPNTLMGRDASGRSQIATPAAAGDIASKGYVDTTVAGYLPTSAKGAASGIASLDSGGFLTVAQIPQNLPRMMGSGTSFPASPRMGDSYYHSGIGCLFSWDSTKWVQAGACVVAGRPALDTMLGSYSAVLPYGFTATISALNSDGLRFRLGRNGWVYAGYDGNNFNGNATETTNLAVVAMYQALNIPIGSGVAAKLIVPNTMTDSSGGNPTYWLQAGSSTFTCEENAVYSINAQVVSDSTAAGWSLVDLSAPAGGGQSYFPSGHIQDQQQRDAGYPSAGTLRQNVSWTGYAPAGSNFSISLSQANTQNYSVSYSVSMAVNILPG